MTFQRPGKGQFVLDIRNLELGLIRDCKIKMEMDL